MLQLSCMMQFTTNKSIGYIDNAYCVTCMDICC